jgi:hypothetical protein
MPNPPVKSLGDEPGRGGTVPAKRELNQHMHRKHPDAPTLSGNTWERLVAHEELHVSQQWDHDHDDYELPAVWHIVRKDA